LVLHRRRVPRRLDYRPLLDSVDGRPRRSALCGRAPRLQRRLALSRVPRCVRHPPLLHGQDRNRADLVPHWRFVPCRLALRPLDAQRPGERHQRAGLALSRLSHTSSPTQIRTFSTGWNSTSRLPEARLHVSPVTVPTRSSPRNTASPSGKWGRLSPRPPDLPTCPGVSPSYFASKL